MFQRTAWGIIVALVLALPAWADEAAGGDRLPLVFRGMMGDVAVVEDLETATQETYHVGDKIRGAKVLEIHPSELILDHHGKRVTLAMGDMLFAESQLSGGAAAPECPWVVPEWASKIAGLYYANNVDLDLKAASLDDIVAVLRRFTGTSLLLDPEAQNRGKGPTSVTIKGESVQRVLDRVLAQFGLAVAYQDNAALITTREKAAANPVVQAMAASRELEEARRFLDHWPTTGSRTAPPSPPDAALSDQLATIRLTATFDQANLTDVVEFIHATAKINIRIDTEHVNPKAEEYLVSMGVRDRKLGDLLEEVTRPRELAYVLREGFVILTTTAFIDEQKEKAEAEEEAAAARAEKDSAVLETKMALRFAGEPLYAVAQKISEATKVPIIVDPKLWGPIPKVTYAGGDTLQAFVDALEKSNEIRTLALRGKVYIVP